MFRKILIKIYTVLGLFAMKHIYGPWSRFYRRRFERSYTKMPPDIPWDTHRVMKFFRTCTWTKDTWYMGFDVMSKPQRLYETLRGDCDEFATFAADVLPHRTKIVLSVTWYDPAKGKKTFNGHNVCAYMRIKSVYDIDNKKNKPKVEWWHISNWGKFGPHRSIHELIDSITPDQAIPCAWSVRIPRARKPEEFDLEFLFGGTFKDRQSVTKD